MHFGRGNPGKEYYIGTGSERVVLEETKAEKDLGIIISIDGKNNRQAIKQLIRLTQNWGGLEKRFSSSI
jgi:hypothetical protein